MPDFYAIGDMIVFFVIAVIVVAIYEVLKFLKKLLS